MLRKMILYGGTLLLAGAVLLEMPSTGWAHGGGGGGGGGGHGGGFGGGHGGGFGGGHFGGGFGGGHFGGGHFGGGFGGGHFGGGFGGGHFGGGHFGGLGGDHFGGYHRGIYGGGFGYGYPYAYQSYYGLSGTYPDYDYYPYSYNYDPYVWSNPAYSSGYYAPYGVGTTSDLYGSTSVTPTAASYPSFTPAATSQPDTIAHLTVNVPAGARLWLEGTPTTRTGPVRQFDSPPLTPGSRYRYQVRASWDENGHEVSQTQQVVVTGGAHVDVKFPAPPKTTAGQTSVRKKG